MYNSPPRILGILGGESESESGASNSLVYDDQNSMISELGGVGRTLCILQVDDNNNRFKNNKSSFDDLWGDDKRKLQHLLP